jgi:hypothetical protein
MDIPGAQLVDETGLRAALLKERPRRVITNETGSVPEGRRLDTNPKSRNFSFDFLLKFLICLTTSLATGCGPSYDRSHRHPEDVVRSFVTAVQAGDFSAAARHWKSDGVKNIERSYGLSFRSFCEQRFRCQNYSIGKATKQKEQFYSVRFTCKDGTGTKVFVFYLELVDQQWVLNYDLWSPDEKKTPVQTNKTRSEQSIIPND